MFPKSSRGRSTASLGSSPPRQLRKLGTSLRPPSPPQQPVGGRSDGKSDGGSLREGTDGKGKKKGGVMRLWMRFDRLGNSELLEWDKTSIIKQVKIPARDLRILGSAFSHSCHILARGKAIVLNLDFVRAIVTAEEVLVLEPLRQDILPFVDQLRQQLPQKVPLKTAGMANQDTQQSQMDDSAGRSAENNEGLQGELPFEFQVLEVALEVVCAYFDSNVADLERDAFPILEEFKRNVSTSSLQNVRSLKSNLSCLLARMQKVRDEIEHLLDDNVDMGHLYLTRKQKQNQQSKALLEAGESESSAAPHLPELTSDHGASLLNADVSDNYDVKDLEQLLEAYFIQLDGTRNKILSIREYIDDTEGYVNIQLDNKRNELIQIQLTLNAGLLPISLEIMLSGAFTMNIPCTLYHVQGIFGYAVGGMVGGGLLLFLLILGYARWKRLLG